VNKFKLTLLISSIALFIAHPSFADLPQEGDESDLIYNDFDEDDFAEFALTNENKIYDPYENINRKIYVFNDYFDRYFFEHVARFYQNRLPKRARKIISNFTNNLSLPLSSMNSFLQGKTDNGLATMSNFIINSTIGVFGFFEIASEKGILYNNEDFGQTLGHYNNSAGAYLMIPFLGPSSTRDFGGFIVDNSISPIGFNFFEVSGSENIVDPAYLIGLTSLSTINKRESLLETLEDVRNDSFDPYATIRSAYSQKRINEVAK